MYTCIEVRIGMYVCRQTCMSIYICMCHKGVVFQTIKSIAHA